MKHLFIFLLISIFYTINTFGQLVVSDPTVASILAKSSTADVTKIAKATATLKNLDEQLSIVKKTQEKLSSVKSVISQAKVVQAILKDFNKIGKILIDYPKHVSNLKSNSSKQHFTEKYDELSQDLNVLTELVNMTVKSNILEANDIDRMKLLLDLKKEVRVLKRSISSENSRLQLRVLNQ